MVNIFAKLWALVLKILNNPKTKEILKKILWDIIMEVIDIIKNKNEQQKEETR